MASSSEKLANLLGKRKPEGDNLEETPHFVEEAAVRKKTLFIKNLSPHTEISDIIDFFKDVGQVVRVRLVVSQKCKPMGYGYVEFASANEAEKALQKQSGEYLHDRKIDLDVVNKGATYFPPKYCIDHKVWYEDYLRRENLMIEDDEAVEGLDDAILFSVGFFKHVGEVVSVRLIVNAAGKHVGHGFVEFPSAKIAKKVLEKKNGEYLHDHKIFLHVAKTVPYPPRPRYEDYLRRESILIEEDEAVEGLDKNPDFVKEVDVRKKTLFVTSLPYNIKISNIISFFKDVGEVRLIVNHMGEFMDCGFVEFASAKEAKKALQKKNGEQLNHRNIFLDVAEIAPYPLRPKYNLAEKLWSEDYLQRYGEDYLEETKPKEPKMDEFCLL